MPPARESVARLSIGALSRATGIPVETLRTWEARYGFPVPERKASGHRVYRTTSVPRLRRIAAALSQGHRAGEVVGASDAELGQLLAATTEAGAGATTGEHRPARTEELLALVEKFDSQQLTLRLLGEAARRGPFAFVRDCVAPLITAVGDSWAEGRLNIHHEHFLSERVGDLLRSQRMPFEERASGPMVILGSLPGEAHALGLQMAALVLSAAGCRVLHLGTELPPELFVQMAKETGARALGISVSQHTKGPKTASHVRRLRAQLPKRVALLVGGRGAPGARGGIEVIGSLDALEDWARRAVAGRKAE